MMKFENGPQWSNRPGLALNKLPKYSHKLGATDFMAS